MVSDVAGGGIERRLAARSSCAASLALPWPALATRGAGRRQASTAPGRRAARRRRAPPSEHCAIIQSVVDEDRPNITLVVIALKTADRKSRLLRVIAPLGVLLPTGLGLSSTRRTSAR